MKEDMKQKIAGCERTRIHKHHWTLNKLEDGEMMELSAENHAKIHGLVVTITPEMSIRREIIFELAKKIPRDKHIEVLTEVVTKIKRNGWFGGGSHNASGRLLKKDDLSKNSQIEEEWRRYADAEYERGAHL
jgi:hypothetical protein